MKKHKLNILKPGLVLMLALMVLVSATACGGKSEEASAAEMSALALPETPLAVYRAPVIPPQPTYRYRVNGTSFLIQAISDAERKVALLTFDDAPEKYAGEIAKTCQSKGASAIFFVNGHFLNTEAQQNMLREIINSGSEIGNHSMTHAHLRNLDYAGQRAEIVGVNDRVEQLTGKRPRFFRPPYGEYNKDTIRICEEEGMTLMNWSFGYDWQQEYMNGPALADVMVNNEFIGAGSNLLMHDRKWTSEAVPAIIDGLKAKGFQIVNPAEIESPPRAAAMQVAMPASQNPQSAPPKNP